MPSRLRLGDTVIDVVKRDIKNVHLTVHPPDGRIRLSAPRSMRDDTLRVFAIAKLGWIRQQQKKIRAQEREAPREFTSRESHYVWGKRVLLVVEEHEAPPKVDLNRRLTLWMRPGSTAEARRDALDAWYRRELRTAAAPLMMKWERRLGVRLSRLFVQHMRTKWGSCNPRSRNIRLNTELAKKPRECLEYTVVHELLHLIEPSHNQRFVDLMNRHMPNWPAYRDRLNRLPVRHEDWRY